MPFEHKNNDGPGRPPGSRNKKTTKFLEELEDLLGMVKPLLFSKIDELSAKELADLYVKTLEYVTPKMNRVNPDGTTGERTIIFNKVIPPLPDGQ